MALPFLLFHAAAGEAVCGCLSFRLQQQHIFFCPCISCFTACDRDPLPQPTFLLFIANQ
jgi:hypothetical protein